MTLPAMQIIDGLSNMIPETLFYLFSAVLLISGILVVSARNPVHAVLFLILAFFNAAGLFLLLGAEFVAFILLIVYVGAVAVLFLFVVMMLDINFADLRKGMRSYLAAGLAVGGVILAQLVFVTGMWVMNPKVLSAAAQNSESKLDNAKALGNVLYTDYVYPFQVSGLILLVAMIGAILLTLRDRKDVRRQSVKQQLDRPISEIIEVVKVESGKGVL